MPSSGYTYIYPKFSYNTVITSSPSLSLYPIIPIEIVSPTLSLIETSLNHPNTATYVGDIQTNGGDCNILTGMSSSYSDSSNYLYFGNGYNGSYKAWIPFEVTSEWMEYGAIPRGQKIAYAVIVFTVKNTSNESANVGIQIGCESLKTTWDSDGRTTYPYTYNDLNSRAMTNAITILPSPIGLWGESGNFVMYDITDSVQEAINGSFWSGGGGLAVMVWNYNSGTGSYNHYRRSYSMEGGEPPILQIGMN